jgi:hypothetical protein
MINNRQVNIWRGDEEPPTIYHVWIWKDLSLKLYNGTEWVTFIDDLSIIEQLNALLDRVFILEDFRENSTINGYKIKDNPTLDADDLKTASTGTFINADENVSNSLAKLDKLLDIEIIE